MSFTLELINPDIFKMENAAICILIDAAAVGFFLQYAVDAHYHAVILLHVIVWILDTLVYDFFGWSEQ